jgi:hypothetical protein
MGYVGQSRKRGNHCRQYRAAGPDCMGCEHQKQGCPRASWKGRMVSRLEQEQVVVARFRAAAAGVIVGVGLSQSAEDSHQLAPAMEVVADGGFTNRESIEKMEERGIDFIGF